MNRSKAKDLFLSEGLKFLRWSANFDQALVKTAGGKDEWISIKGDIAATKKRLESLKTSAVAQS